MVPEDWKEPPVKSPIHGVTGRSISALPPTRSSNYLGINPINFSKRSRKSNKSTNTNGYNSAVESGTVTPEEGKISDYSTVASTPGFRSSKTNGTSTPVTSSTAQTDIENNYKIRLTTEVFDTIAATSDVRRSTRFNKQAVNYYQKAKEDLGLIKKNPLVNEAKTPESQLIGKRNERSITPSPNEQKAKKVKITLSPQKSRENPYGFNDTTTNRITQPRQSTQVESKSTPENENIDYCAACGGSGKFLCCETCPNSFHFTCLDPPLEEDNLPDGEWFCKECYVKRNPPTPYRRSLFSKLLNQLERRNPVQFKLPKKIIDRFEGVTRNSLGEYEDEVPKSRPASKDDNSDPLKLLDKNGSPRLCYKCKMSPLRGTMVTCDTCSLNWHVDCLPTPVWAIGARWQCPNHVEQVIKLPRKLRNTKVIDTVLNRGFENDGDIEILDSSDEEEVVKEIPFFDNYDTRYGIGANFVREKTFSSDEGIVYRLPARSIKLDFIEAVQNSNEDPYTESVRSEILLALDELAIRPKDEREVVRDLCYLQSEGDQSVRVVEAKHNLDSLVEAALGNNNNNYNIAQEYPPILTAGSTSVGDRDDDLSQTATSIDSEKDDLLMIKRLMQVKGKEKLLKFLMDDDS